jgi:hypothetical protein
VAINNNFEGYPRHEMLHVTGRGDDLLFLNPALPATLARPVKISGGGDTWFAEGRLTYPDSTWLVVGVWMTQGEHVADETIWYCPPEPPGWRSEWSQPMPGSSEVYELASGSPSSVRQHEASTSRFLDALADDIESAVRGFFTEDAVYEYPQTAETVRGVENLVSLYEANPDPPISLAERWQVGNFGLFTATRPSAPDDGWAVFITQFANDRVRKLTEYWAPRLPAPEWRSEWVVSDSG